MVRKFKTADYPSMLKQSILIEECLPANHLARFVVEEVAALDLREIYNAYGDLRAISSGSRRIRENDSVG